MEVKQYPEWKEMLAKMQPLCVVDRIFTWNELSELLGLDARRGRGYAQLRRFMDEALKRWNVAFESIQGKGYRVAQADEHNGLAVRQVKFSQRHLRKGLKIATHVDDAALTAAGRAQNDDLRCRLARLIAIGKKEVRENHRIAKAPDVPRIAIGGPTQ